MAYELCGLLPWDFERLTPREFERMQAAALARLDHLWDRTAWIVAHLMNAAGFMKSPMTVRRLLGREFGRGRTLMRRAAATREQTPEEQVMRAALWTRILGGEDRRPDAPAVLLDPHGRPVA